MKCRACGLEHESWIRCEVAKARDQSGGGGLSDVGSGRMDSKEPVVEEVKPQGSKRGEGEVKTPFDRKAYQREYMRRYRARRKTVD